MMISDRHRKIIEELQKDPKTSVRTLAKMLSVSEPTVRRDFTELHEKGIITKVYGGAILNRGGADGEIPFLVRENEKSSAKAKMGQLASDLVRDGMVIMLDGSTSAYHLVPYLAKYKDIIVITSGAKTAVALAEANIRTFCTGGQMMTNSLSYVGEAAESFVRKLNADILFFSCHGLTDDGQLTERIIEEANLRRVMFSSCKKKILLCDSSKFGVTCLYNMGDVSELDGIITEADLPDHIQKLVNEKARRAHN